PRFPGERCRPVRGAGRARDRRREPHDVAAPRSDRLDRQGRSARARPRRERDRQGARPAPPPRALAARAPAPPGAPPPDPPPPPLREADLCGNVTAPPRGGTPERPGLMGEAPGGPLSPAESGETPPALHASLLRVLDGGGEYHRLGSSTARRADIRLIAATNR